MEEEILLDTNALLLLLDPSGGKLGDKSIAAIQDARVVYASAASIFEIQTKSMLGKLKSPDNLLEIIEKSNLRLLDITSYHSVSIKLFPDLKKHDPLDRLLLSQSLSDDLSFMTSDEFMLGLKDSGIKMYNAAV